MKTGDEKKKKTKQKQNPEIFSLYNRRFTSENHHSLVRHRRPSQTCSRGDVRVRNEDGGEVEGSGPGACSAEIERFPSDREGGDVIYAREARWSASSYVLGAWLRLWGWSCCRFCCSCTASCWHWSDVESLLINADTQFAGMMSPVEDTKETSP